ncbi:MAG: flavodoxin [Vibrio sp.]
MLPHTETSQIEHYVQAKNSWMAQQVEVEYPTPESLAGRQYYLNAQENIQYQESLLTDLAKGGWVDEIVEVDFHKLTVLFAQVQAQYWADNEEAERLIIEFLTQIILDDEYHLVLGFVGGEVAASLIYKIEDDVLLAFDVALNKKHTNQARETDFIGDFVTHLSSKLLKQNKVIHPKNC